MTLLEGPVRLVAGRGAALRPAPVKPELSTAHPPPKAKSRLFRAAEQADSTGFPVSMRAAASWLLEQAPPHTDAVWRAPPLHNGSMTMIFPNYFKLLLFFLAINVLAGRMEGLCFNIVLSLPLELPQESFLFGSYLPHLSELCQPRLENHRLALTLLIFARESEKQIETLH